MSKASGLIGVTDFQPIQVRRIGPYVKGVLELQRFDFASGYTDCVAVGPFKIPKGTGTILGKDAEDDIVSWVDDLRKEGVPISTLMLSLKADEVATNYNVDNFHASWCWRLHSKSRHRLSFRSRTRQGQQTPAHLTKVRQDFAAKVSTAMDKFGVTTVYNADQTAAFFSICQRKQLIARVQRQFGSGAQAPLSRSKDIDTDEVNRRLRRGFGIHVWKDITKLHESEDLEIYGNIKGWWNHDLSTAFLRHHFEVQDLSANSIIAELTDLHVLDDQLGDINSDLDICNEDYNE